MNQKSQVTRSTSGRSCGAMSLQFALTTLLLLYHASGTSLASGVFELELLKLEHSNSNQNSTTEQQVDSSQTNATKLSQEDPTKLVQILVCLKEAFTSQLDGPCTFGNASITLLKATGAPGDLSQDQASSKQQNSSQPLQQGSLSTNVVRILFTFRWTKSFTIILTAEQLAQNELQQQDNLSNKRAQQLAPHQGQSTGSGPSESPLAPIQASANRSSREQQQTASRTNKSQFIDRHVLTENEVLPNLEPNQNKPWVSRYSRNPKSSLAYRFRVYCSLNYYGDGCTNFCRPREDQFGHYNCSSSGQKVCHEGWHGPDCDRAQCRSGCNLQHGYCDKPDTCQCRPGWTGSRCDECIPYPGCQNGYCLSPWQCICQRNWGGVFCDQDLDHCGSKAPCKNNGTCQNVAPGKYKCHCPDGFTGVHCDINLNVSSTIQASSDCTEDPCLNGGTCFGFRAVLDDASYFVSALNSSAESQSASKDLQDDRSYRCQCPPGWSGDYCQWPDLPPVPTTPITAITTSTTATVESTTLDSRVAQSNSSEAPPAAPDFETHLDSAEPLIDRSQTIFTTFVESAPSTTTQHVDLKHLISWVVIASVIGVFLASLLLAWCCLIAVEKNGFSFIQMNIVRADREGDGDGGFGQPAVASTLRRMHEKIRDSFRLPSRCRIRPETKLSLENVLRPPKQPPPPYEEAVHNILSDNVAVNLREHHDLNSDCRSKKSMLRQEEAALSTKGSLVIRGALEQKLSATTSSTLKIEVPPAVEATKSNIDPDQARLNCPRHGHLYRQQPVEPPGETNRAPKITIGRGRQTILVGSPAHWPIY